MVHRVAKSGTQWKRLSTHPRQVRLWQKLSEFCFTVNKRGVEDFPHVYAHVRVCLVSCSATRWTVAHQAALSVGFSRQDYWGGFPFPSPGDLPHPGIEPASPVPPALAGILHCWDTWEALLHIYRPPFVWWTWVWVNSWSWWWTGRPGMLQFMGSQRVGHDWATELNWTDLCFLYSDLVFFLAVCVILPLESSFFFLLSEKF